MLCKMKGHDECRCKAIYSEEFNAYLYVHLIATVIALPKNAHLAFMWKSDILNCFNVIFNSECL